MRARASVARFANALLVRVKGFCRNEGGGVAPLAAVLAVPLLASVGVAVDYNRVMATRTAMQASLDSTALALAKENSGSITSQQAQQTFTAILSRSDLKNASVVAQTATPNANSSSFSASATLDTPFLQVIGYSNLSITVSSVVYSSTAHTGCVLALNKTASNAIVMSGSTNVNLVNCALYGDSQSNTALVVSGGATLTALAVSVVGKTSISSSNIFVTDGISTNAASMADPYADLQVPAYSGCTDTNLKVTSSKTIDQGVYCGGISVSGNGGGLTLNPGVYYIDGGSLSVSGGASVTGQGVTIIFTSSSGKNWATASISGGSSITLTAPNSGPTAGIVLFGDPNMPVGTKFTFSGGSGQAFGGAVYIPTGALSVTGGSGASGNCTQIIADTITFSGNSSVALNCSGYKIRPFGGKALRLAS